MTTDVDASPRPGWIRRAAALGILAATGTLAFVLYGAWADGSTAPPMSPDQLRAAVTTQLTTAMEQATPAEHESHGHHDLGAAAVFCAVEVLGYEPADAADPQQVRTVYANHLCAVSDNGRPWDYAVKTAGPLVATWGASPVIQVVAAGDGYPERVRAAIPAQYHEKALGSTMDDRALLDMRTRYDANVAEFWAKLKASTPPTS